MKTLLIITGFLLIGCSNKGMYEAIKQNECRQKTGEIYCDDVTDYETYKQERDELLKKQEDKGIY